MTEADQAALRLAVEMTLADPDHGGVEQVTKFINGYDNEKLRPMLAVNKFCSYYHRPKMARDHHPPRAPPHDEIEGGRVVIRDMPLAGGAEGWPRAEVLFTKLMRRAYGAVVID
jgi:hypothetical protein